MNIPVNVNINRHTPVTTIFKKTEINLADHLVCTTFKKSVFDIIDINFAQIIPKYAAHRSPQAILNKATFFTKECVFSIALSSSSVRLSLNSTVNFLGISFPVLVNYELSISGAVFLYSP